MSGEQSVAEASLTSESIAALLMGWWEQTSASGAFGNQPQGRPVAVSANIPLRPVERPDEPGPWNKVQEGLPFSLVSGPAVGPVSQVDSRIQSRCGNVADNSRAISGRNPPPRISLTQFSLKTPRRCEVDSARREDGLSTTNKPVQDGAVMC